MKSKVYFAQTTDADTKETIKAILVRLLEQSGILDFIQQGQKVVVKMHFGEDGNTGFVRPEYVKLVCQQIAKRQALSFLADTNTLYKGRRSHSDSHYELAREHGFTKEATGAEIVIADGSEDVEINHRFIKTANIAPFFLKADAIVNISHFKGHIMTGFGGALKNLGMGCASRQGKLAQHAAVAPVIKTDACVGCSECQKACPADAISMIDNPQAGSAGQAIANIDNVKCIGCATCIAACPHYAIDVKWEAGAGNMQEKMVEYAKAVLTGKRNKSAHINFAIKITKECDCLAKDDPKISPDIGIFASHDPVSVDKASVDAVNSACGRDIFKEVQPKRDWAKQLNCARKLGLGNLEYELIKI